jgi:hypothetical protein
MREVIGRRRVDTINGDGSSKLKREWKGRWETGEAVTRLHLPVVRQRLEGCAVRQRWPNQQRRHGHQEAAAWPSAWGRRRESGMSWAERRKWASWLGGPDWTKNGPRQPGGPCTLENEPGQKNEKEENIEDGLQETFEPKSDWAAKQNRKLFLNFWFREMGFKSKVLNISKPKFELDSK